MEKSNDVFFRDSIRSPSLGGDAECVICAGVMWFSVTLIQPGKLMDYAFPFKASGLKRGLCEQREYLKHLRAVHYLIHLTDVCISVVPGLPDNTDGIFLTPIKRSS